MKLELENSPRTELKEEKKINSAYPFLSFSPLDENSLKQHKVNEKRWLQEPPFAERYK